MVGQIINRRQMVFMLDAHKRSNPPVLTSDGRKGVAVGVWIRGVPSVVIAAVVAAGIVRWAGTPPLDPNAGAGPRDCCCVTAASSGEFEVVGRAC